MTTAVPILRVSDVDRGVDDVDQVATEFGVSIDEMPWARDCEISNSDGNRVRAATARR